MKTKAGKTACAAWLLAASLWAYWGAAEFGFEAWGVPEVAGWPYFMPALAVWLPGLVALWRPRPGGWLLILLALAFTTWWWGMAVTRGLLTWRRALGTAPVSLLLVGVGALWLLEARAAGDGRRSLWPATVPVLVALATLAYYAPYVMNRTPAATGSWVVETAGMRLEWAPAGPGWNQRVGGRYPSWDELASYGRPPIGLSAKPGPHDPARYGLCAYLDSRGEHLLDEPVFVWRLPTRAELAASLVRDGRLAGCRYDGGSAAECARVPNKEGPLWDPVASAVYYWTVEAEDGEAWYVPYTGGLRYGGRIARQPGDWGNPRHGYRCVRLLR